MSNSYNFNVTVLIPEALDQLIKTTASFASIYTGLSTNGGVVTVFTTQALTDDQLTELTNIVTTYVDPAYFLSLDHTSSYPMHSHYTKDPYNVIMGNSAVLETIIFATPDPSSPLVLDAAKTVLEFNCPNVNAFYIATGNTTTDYVNLSIYDVTRQAQIATQQIPLSDIAAGWNAEGATGSTSRSVNWRSTMFTGIMNQAPNYDCVWQLRGNVSSPEIFDFRVNALQYLWYNVIYPSS